MFSHPLRHGDGKCVKYEFAPSYIRFTYDICRSPEEYLFAIENPLVLVDVNLT